MKRVSSLKELMHFNFLGLSICVTAALRAATTLKVILGCLFKNAVLAAYDLNGIFGSLENNTGVIIAITMNVNEPFDDVF